MGEPIAGSEAHASWLTGKQMGRDEEQARIIKLLEDIDPQTFGCPHFEEHTKMAMFDIIALIKGENK